MKSSYLAKNAKRARSRPSSIVTLPAPTAGWSVAENLSQTSPGTAQIMENFRPTTTGARMRAGSRTVATISSVGAAVISLFNYNAPGMKKLFAASATSIFDVTSVASPTVPPVAVKTGQTSGYYSFVNFTTSGGQYMTVVNGTDNLLLYEPGTGFVPLTPTSTPAITGISSTALLSFVWVYRARQFFIEANSLRARYLPVGSIAGALGTLDFNGIFQRGGALLFGGTWSMDTGDGLDDKCVFVTTEGEVAIFEGSNPSGTTTADWNIVGRYDITRPLGPRATMRAGGDLVIATEDGLVPISEAVNKDISVISIASISRAIASVWKTEAAVRTSIPWEVMKYPEKGYAIVSTPVTAAGQAPISLVVNTETGKWCKYTNWDTRCLGYHRGQLYFGTNDGRVKLAEVGGNDDGAGIYYTLVSNPEHLKTRGKTKTILQARATYSGSTPFIDQVSVSTDYKVSLPPPPASAPNVTANEWDAGLWDQALWDAAAGAPEVRARWVSIGRSGYVMQYQLQVTGGLTPPPDVELVSIDFSLDLGEAIV